MKYRPAEECSVIVTLLEEYYWRNGKLPEDFASIEKAYRRVRILNRNDIRTAESFSWELVEPPGSHPMFPNLAELVIHVYYLDAEKNSSIHMGTDLGIRGMHWVTVSKVTTNYKWILVREPENIAATIAWRLWQGMQHRDALQTRSSFWSSSRNDDLRRWGEAAGATWRIVRYESNEWIEVQLEGDPRRFLFSVNGPNSPEQMKVVER